MQQLFEQDIDTNINFSLTANSIQNGKCAYLAFPCSKAMVIHEKTGEEYTRIPLRKTVVYYSWNSSGTLLAILMAGSSDVCLWDVANKTKTLLPFKGSASLSNLAWCPNKDIFIAVSSKSQIYLFDCESENIIPIITNTIDSISEIVWSCENIFGVINSGVSIAFFDIEGNSLRNISWKKSISHLKFPETSIIGLEKTFSANMNRSALIVSNYSDETARIKEVHFLEEYGQLVDYQWFSQGSIVVGFSTGLLVVFSAHALLENENCEESYQFKAYDQNLYGLAISNEIGKLASVGDQSIKIHSLSNIRDVSTRIDLEVNLSRNVGNVYDEVVIKYSDNGQILLAGLREYRKVYSFLTNIPALMSIYYKSLSPYCFGMFLAHPDPSSPQEIALEFHEFDVKSSKPRSKKLLFSHKCGQQFTSIAVSDKFLAYAANNILCVHKFRTPMLDGGTTDVAVEIELNKKTEFDQIIKKITLSTQSCCVLLIDGTANYFNLINAKSHNIALEEICKTLHGNNFNDISQNENQLFLCYEKNNKLKVISTLEGKVISEYTHSDSSIRSIYTNSAGTRGVIVDNLDHGYVINFSTGFVQKIEKFPSNTVQVLIDQASGNFFVFLAVTESKIHYFQHRDMRGILGSKDSELDEHQNSWNACSFSKGIKLVSLQFGELGFLDASRNFNSLLLDPEIPTDSEKDNLKMRFNDSLNIVSDATFKGYVGLLTKGTLNSADFRSAALLFERAKSPSNALLLKKLIQSSDPLFCHGMAALSRKSTQLAQKYFLQSSSPSKIVDVYIDLLQWDFALKLAKKLAPEILLKIHLEYGTELEHQGDFTQALSFYEQGCALPESPTKQKSPKKSTNPFKRTIDWEDHLAKCNAGISRCSLQIGDIKRGIRMAKTLKNTETIRECAVLLEKNKSFCEAAHLFEDAKIWESAVRNWLLCKNNDRAGELLSQHRLSPKLYEDYAKVREAEGQYHAAVEAYQLAQDWNSCVRIYLDRLGSTEEAVKIVQLTKNVSGAKKVADYFMKMGDQRSSIEFLVFSQCGDMAFKIAEKHGLMKSYTSFLDESTSKGDYLRIANYYEQRRDSLEAAIFYFKAKEYHKALNYLLTVPYNQDFNNPALDLAIQLVGESQSQELADIVLSYLKGDLDRSVSKDARYLFKLFMVRKQFKEAAHTAVIIAREERDTGNYRRAHTLLKDMIIELREHELHIPLEMLNNLMLLHSYLLAKLHLKNGDHVLAARLLLRVAENISKFRLNTVPILTSVVIECQRAGLKNACFQYVAILMQPENRSKIDPKYAKRFEMMLRKTDHAVENSDPSPLATPCPFCGSNTPSFDLICRECKNLLPFCIITGEHVCKDDLALCASCRFPASYKLLLTLAEDQNALCPMCSQLLNRNEIRRIADANDYLKSNWLTNQSGRIEDDSIFDTEQKQS